MTAGLPLMKSVLTPLDKIVLLPLGLLPEMSAADAAIQKRIYGSGTTALITSNKEMAGIMKRIKSFEELELLIKEISGKIKNKAKEQKGGFLGMLLGTSGAILLGSALTGRRAIRAVKVKLEQVKISMPPLPLTNFEIQKYYQTEPKFNDVYSRNNFSKIKDGAYITNLDEYKSIGTHWIALHVNVKSVTHFDSFGVEHIPKEIRKFIGNKSITTNIHRMQANDSILCGYFSIGFVDFISKGKSLLEYPNLFSPNEYKNNNKIMLKYFQ